MTSLGFENYAEALKIYLSKYREVSPRPKEFPFPLTHLYHGSRSCPRGVSADTIPRHSTGQLMMKNSANSSSSRIRQIVARTSKTVPAVKAMVRLRARANLDRAAFPAMTLVSKRAATLKATTSMVPRQVITVVVLKDTRRLMASIPISDNKRARTETPEPKRVGRPRRRSAPR